MTRRRWFYVALSVVTLFTLLPYSAPSGVMGATQQESQYFPQTRKTLTKGFLDYWHAHGGLVQQGFPISETMSEVSQVDGRTYTVQYFERAVFEAHPENAAPYDVLLSLLGSMRYDQVYPSGALGQVPNNEASSQLFAVTGKRVGGLFLAYWHEHGALAQQGYPISDEFTEVSSLDKKPYKVQYFERAVFEYHPENSPPYNVLLSQLGTYSLASKHSSPVPSPTTATATATPITAVSTISAAALAYLQEALDFIQQNAILRDRVDWAQVRSQALEMARGAQLPKDTYPAIKFAIASLNDNHSQFLENDEFNQFRYESPGFGALISYAERRVLSVTPDSSSAKAGLLSGDLVETINGKPIDSLGASNFFTELYAGRSVTLTILRTAQEEDSAEDDSPTVLTLTITHDEDFDISPVPQGRRLPGNIGYISLPYLIVANMFEPYQSITQQIIRDIDQLPTCGWVVDLQTNGGGNFPAMLVGIGPILGEGMAGAFIDVNGHKTSWGYINGRAVIYDNGEQEYGSPLADPYSLKIQQPPAAVLTSNQTGSAAEATLISFRGRSDTQTFGQATAGVPSGVGGKVLSDGAMIALTMALEADRTGRVYAYNEKVQPDAFVHGIPRLVGTDDDPVLRAATAWLSTQSRCTETIDAVSSLNP